MAWPYDARSFTFGGGIYIPSATLNSMQDEIIDLHEEHTGQNIWVDMLACGQNAAAWDWLFPSITGGGTSPANPATAGTTGEPCYEAQTVQETLWFEVSDWPEGMTLNSITVDWTPVNTSITTYELRMYAARHVWVGGALRTHQQLKSAAPADYVAGTQNGNRAAVTFTCDSNNTNWTHATHKLVITINSNDTLVGDKVHGIRLNVDYFGTNKWFRA